MSLHVVYFMFQVTLNARLTHNWGSLRKFPIEIKFQVKYMLIRINNEND
jgi:hypothetical protein